MVTDPFDANDHDDDDEFALEELRIVLCQECVGLIASDSARTLEGLEGQPETRQGKMRPSSEADSPHPVCSSRNQQLPVAIISMIISPPIAAE